MSTIARLSLSEYDRMIECGVFDASRRRRIEFIRGEIREMTPIGPRHDAVVAWLTQWSVQILPETVGEVRIQSSLGLPDLESVPQPDLVWVVPGGYYWDRRPLGEQALLVVEVAETSLAYDRGEKADLYAEAGIADYWIINIPDRSIEVHREPREGRYHSVRVCTGNEEIRPLAFVDAVLRPSALFAIEGGSGTGRSNV